MNRRRPIHWRGIGTLVLLSLIHHLQAINPSPVKAQLVIHADPDRSIGFVRMGEQTSGVTFTNRVAVGRSQTNQILLDGSGVALADVDNDGRVDLFLAASDGGSRLWRNRGDWRFDDATQVAFPQRIRDLSGDVTGCVFADLNADGAPDLILNTHADGLRVLLNDGHGVFHPMPFHPSSPRGGHSISVADVDGDGWVDVYVCNYRKRALMDMPSARATFKTVQGVSIVATLDGRPTTEPDLTNRFTMSATGELEESGEPDVLYMNQGGTNLIELDWTGGHFLDEEGQLIKAPLRDWGLAAQFCDINDDGRPDLYVCNDFQSPDRLWINQSSPGRVQLRLVSPDALRHTSLFSMGVDFADLNRDGRWDFFVVDMLSPDHVRRLTTQRGNGANREVSNPRSRPQTDANTLFIQRSGGSFAEVANFSGVVATDWSWTPAFLDVDLDGWPDLLVTAGQERGSRDLDVAEQLKRFRRSGLRTDAQIFRERQKFAPLFSPLKAFRNRPPSEPGGIPTFEDVSTAWGFDWTGVSHGLALADLDGDGDLDVVVNHLGAPAGLYRNVSAAPRIAVHLKGRAPNTGAIGSQLRFWWEGTPGREALPQMVQISAGGHYLSSDDFTKAFACPGPGTGRLEVRWPSGQRTTYSGLAANQRYEINEPETPSGPDVSLQNPAPARRRLNFEAKSLSLPTHSPIPTDFTAEPSLPRLQSTRSPVLTISSSVPGEAHLWVGGMGQALRQIPLTSGLEKPGEEKGRVQTPVAMLAWGNRLIVASQAWAPDSQGRSNLVLLDPDSGLELPISTRAAAISCLAIDHSQPASGTRLFVGGGSSRGDYSSNSLSEVLRWDGTGFVSESVMDAGLVTGAVYADMDGDGGKELITVSEWGAPAIRQRKDAGWVESNPSVVFGPSATVRLGELDGWWQSLAVADVDGDGRPDLILGNWGLNSAYALQTGGAAGEQRRNRTLVLYDGPVGVSERTCLEGYEGRPGVFLPIHGLSDMARHLPWVQESFRTHRAFAEATLDDILGERIHSMKRRESSWLSSLILYQRGDHLEARLLPDLAQLGPVFALQTADFDGDGRMDVYAGQGFFGGGFGMTRDDGGEGVFLMGRKEGGLEPVGTVDAGFRILGEQRSVLVHDIDGDGRPDLLIGEFGGPVTALRNRNP